MKVKELKTILKDGFVYLDKYENGDAANKYIFNEKMPHYSQLRDACYNANMEIDDYHFTWFSYAFDAINTAIADFDDAKEITDEERDFIENYEFEGIEADCYTYDLTKWLNSSVERVYYLTEALEEMEIKDGFALLSYAQEMEMREVYDMARKAILELIEE